MSIAQKLFSSTLVCAALLGGAPASAAEEAPLKPIPLDWKAIKIAPLDFERVSVEGGAGLFTIPGKGEKKFRIDLLFSTGIYHFPEKELAASEAVPELLIKGGAGQRNFEELDNFLSENGIEIAARLNANGKLRVVAEGLSEDFDQALALLEDVLLRPRFDAEGFKLWKQERIDTFSSVLDGGNSRKQGRFMSLVLNRMALGENHPLTQTLKRQSPKVTESLDLARIRSMAKTMVSRAGLNAVLSGGYSATNKASLMRLLTKIPRGEIAPDTWLPARPVAAPGPKTRVVVLHKPDMKQCRIEVRSFVMGTNLNRVEKAESWIAEDVFSTSAGVVGNDRWTKAMRGDSGFGYAPSAWFTEKILQPNTGVSLWMLSFQSPNERVGEAIRVYKKTWDEYVGKGVTPDESEWARISQMNSRLAREKTIFDKATDFMDDLGDGLLPSPIPTELTLARLDVTRNTASINQTLGRIGSQNVASVMVIMGNPAPEALADLAKQGSFEVGETLEFSKLVGDLQQ